MQIPDNLTRQCPVCKGDIVYKSKRCYYHAEKSHRRCRPCADEATRQKTRTPEHRRLKSEQTIKERNVNELLYERMFS